jgi:hypothetical protein
MGASDWIAILALAISCGALALEVRRWVESGPRLHLSVMNEGKYSGDDEDNTYIFVTVPNRGSAPTTIQYLTLHLFDNWIMRLRNKPSWSALIPNPSPWLSPIPFEVATNKMWHGGARYEHGLEDRRETGKLYIGVGASHRNRFYYKRVRPKVVAPA